MPVYLRAGMGRDQVIISSTFFFLQKPIKKILCNATIVFHGIL